MHEVILGFLWEALLSNGWWYAIHFHNEALLYISFVVSLFSVLGIVAYCVIYVLAEEM